MKFMNKKDDLYIKEPVYLNQSHNTHSEISLKKLVFLHLAPGVLVLIMIFIFATKEVSTLFGIDQRLAPVFGLVTGSLFVLTELIYLFIQGKRRNNSYSLRGVLHYTQKCSKKEYALYIPVLTLLTIILLSVIAPLVQPFFVDTFFWWWPEEFNFQSIFQDKSFLGSMKGMNGIYLITILYVLFMALILPVVEELYFRGFLLRELDKKYGKWSVIINSVLFSVCHFFSPWENFIRIIAVSISTYVVYWKKDIRLSILSHVLANFIGALALILMIFVL